MNKKPKTKKKSKQKSITVKKAYRQILVADKAVFRQNMRTYKGNKNDTNVLNINFKTIICRTLQQMRLIKQITHQEAKSIIKFRESTPSFNSLIELIYQPQQSMSRPEKYASNQKSQNYSKTSEMDQKTLDSQSHVKSPNILQGLRKLFESSEIVSKIHQTQSSITNKLLMLKYLQAIRYTIIGNGGIVKWKQLKEVTVPK